MFYKCIIVVLLLGNMSATKATQYECNGGNETWSDTGNHGCQNTCLNPNIAPVCRPIPKAGCICVEGYFRDSFGKCVLPSDCDACGGDVRKQFLPCGNTCPVTCANKDSPRACPEICLYGGGCGCRPEYVEDINGNCILPSECPNCGPNAYYGCGSACDRECATIGKDCPIKNIDCVERCYCNDGYARNQKGDCIPIDRCPAKPTCPRNQRYNPCPFLCPPQKTCQNYILPNIYACVLTTKCYPSCECKSGFVRKNVNGTCILPKNCCDDPNAEVVSCPNPCPGGTCISPKFADSKAPCKITGCQCKKDYVKDDRGKCILLSQCPVSNNCETTSSSTSSTSCVSD